VEKWGKRTNSRARKALVIDQGLLFYRRWSPEHLTEAVRNLDKSLTTKEGINPSAIQLREKRRVSINGL